MPLQLVTTALPILLILGFAIFMALRGRTWLHRSCLAFSALALAFLPVYLYYSYQTSGFFAGTVPEYPGMSFMRAVSLTQIVLFVLAGGLSCVLQYKEFCVRRVKA